MTAPPMRDHFTSVARAPQLGAASEISGEAAGWTDRKGRVLQKAEEHFEKHKDRWTAKVYGELLKRESPAPALKPFGLAEDRTATLMRAATHLVERKQFLRIGAIKRANLRSLSSERGGDLQR